MIVSVMLGQVPIGWDVPENLATVESVLDEAHPQEIVVLPEGMLSGYDDQLSGLATLEPEVVNAAIGVISKIVHERGLHLFCGTLMFEGGGWSNALLYFSPDGKRQVYRKVNLATHERPFLVAGSHLPIFDLEFGAKKILVSPQLCRELRFPDQCHYPAREGAQVFIYLSCAANPRESRDVWRSHLISRAAETQRFVIAVNVARSDGHSPTMMISPSGEVISEASTSDPMVIRAQIDTNLVSDWYVGQQRSDIIEIANRSNDFDRWSATPPIA
jgi:predicted amidohydrolase